MELIQQILKTRIFQILTQKSDHVSEHIFTFEQDGIRSYYLTYDSNGYSLFLESQKIAYYPIFNLIDAAIVDQIVSDILNVELVARIMEVDRSFQGWSVSENVGIGIANPRGLKQLRLKSD